MKLNLRTTVLLLGACGLAAGVSAQGGGNPPFSGLLPNATFPSDHTPDLVKKKLVDGTNSHWAFPFSWGKARQMALYESHDLKIPNGKKITHVGFQAEAGVKSKGYKVLLKIFMGKSKETAKSMQTTYAKNYDGAPTNVYGGTAGKILDLPDLGDSLNPNKDRPFLWVKLDTPYVYDSSRNLLVDYHVLGNNNSNNAFFYYTDVAHLVSPVAHLGDGCKDGSGRIPVLKSSATAIGGKWYVNLSKAPTSSNTVFVFSFGKAAAPVPFFRPDCKIHIDLNPPFFVPFLFLGKTNTTGRYGWNFSVPDDPIFNDVHLYSQCVVEDFFAPAGITLSNADDMQIGMHPQMSIASSQGDPATLTTGGIRRNLGVISHFKF